MSKRGPRHLTDQSHYINWPWHIICNGILERISYNGCAPADLIQLRGARCAVRGARCAVRSARAEGVRLVHACMCAYVRACVSA